MEIWLRGLIPRFKLYKYPSLIFLYEKYAAIRYRSKFEKTITFRGALFNIGKDVTLFPSVYLGSYEEKELDLLLDQEIKSGEVFWDIGANIGLYSVLFCKKFPNSRVISFEPNIELHKYLEQNFQSNRLENYKIAGVALSNSSGKGLIEHARKRAGAGKIVSETYALHPISRIEITTGDLFLATNREVPPRFIKIDVEGHEPEVIEGLGTIIEAHRPILSIEVFQKLWDVNRELIWDATIIYLFKIYTYGYLISDGKISLVSEWNSELLSGGMQTLIFGAKIPKD